MGTEQRLNALAKLGVARAFTVEKGGAFGGGLFYSQRKQGFFV